MKKDGETVPRLVITSLVFIVDLVIGLTPSKNFDAVITPNSIDILYGYNIGFRITVIQENKSRLF